MRSKNHLQLFGFLLLFLILIVSASAQSSYGPQIKKESYEISRSKVEREITQGEIFRDSIRITNLEDKQIRVTLTPSTEIISIMEFDSSGALISPSNFTDFYFTLTGKELKNYAGEIIISNDINEKIGVNISVKNDSNRAGFFVSIEPIKKVFTFEESLDFNIDVQKILDKEVRNVTFSYFLKNQADNSTHPLGKETKDLLGSLQIRKKIDFPEDLEEGYYILDVFLPSTKIKQQFQMQKSN